jgi:hypothetical protein
MEQQQSDSVNERTETPKPIGMVFVNALALLKVSRTVTAERFITNMIFEPHGRVAIAVEAGRIEVDTIDCDVMEQESMDGASIALVVSPAIPQRDGTLQ